MNTASGKSSWIEGEHNCQAVHAIASEAFLEVPLNLSILISFVERLSRLALHKSFCGVPRLHKIWVKFSFANENKHGKAEGGGATTTAFLQRR